MRVLIALSGGVDSSVAAALLAEQGHELVGVTFHLWDAQGENKVGRCCAPEDRDDARRSAEHVGIPHYVIDERRAFRSDVVEPRWMVVSLRTFLPTVKACWKSLFKPRPVAPVSRATL